MIIITAKTSVVLEHLVVLMYIACLEILPMQALSYHWTLNWLTFRGQKANNRLTVIRHP